MMKVALYLRVSTEDQVKEGPRRFVKTNLKHRDRYSFEVQREYLESFAKRQVIYRGSTSIDYLCYGETI